MPSCKYIVNFIIAAHIYIVAVLRSLFISHILVFLVPIARLAAAQAAIAEQAK